MTPLTTPQLCALLRQVKPEHLSGVWFEPRKAADVIEALAAEVAHIREQWANGVAVTRVESDAWMQRAEAAEAECERLRDALENIERFHPSGFVGQTARAALAVRSTK